MRLTAPVRIFFLAVLLSLAWVLPAWAIAPPLDVQAKDTPNDAGKSITVTWKKSPDDRPGVAGVAEYRILRGTSLDGPSTFVGTATGGTELFTDNTAQNNINYYYKIVAVAGDKSEAESLPSAPTHAYQQWFNAKRVNLLIGVLLLSFAIIYFIEQAKKGKPLFIRKIAGLEAVDEAIGRATEMGKKVLYIPGIQDLDNVQTVAGVTILGRVAKVAAEYETHLEVPTSRALVMVACREAVQEGYSLAGRPDAYNQDRIYYLTDEQFGYAAGVDGIIVREKPAAIFYQGCFFAESLILSETGNSIGAIQIAGTAQPTQLPFFFAACDYTLIGEELFAASAYLSREPRQLGSLKGQDIGKALIMLAVLAGAIWQTLAVFFPETFHANAASLFLTE